jgi:hypothetical protein
MQQDLDMASFLGRRGRYLGSPDWHTDVERRPNLAPRQTCVIFDYVILAAGGQTRKFKIKLPGTKFRDPAKRSPATVEGARGRALEPYWNHVAELRWHTESEKPSLSRSAAFLVGITTAGLPPRTPRS